jgi:lipopolysaccharide transport system ATP-binding protein
MYVRLAFAVAAFLEPEILIVDEVLAVGDAEFQKKCLGRMKDVSVNDGRTVLFVSHNMTAVQHLCGRCVFLENGAVKSIGDSGTIIKEYQGNTANKQAWSGFDGDSNVSILSTEVLSHDESIELFNDAAISIRLKIDIKAEQSDIVIGLNILSGFGHPLLRLSFNDYNDIHGLSPGIYEVEFVLPKYTLATGLYQIEFDVAIPHVKKINSEKIDLFFNVNARGEYGNKYFVENSLTYNSIVRPNWFSNITQLAS